MTEHCHFVISGCIYLFKGSQKGRDLIFKLKEIKLPPPCSDPLDFARLKFMEGFKQAKVTAENINNPEIIKRKLGSYNIASLQRNTQSPVLVIGNITLNLSSVGKIRHILKTLESIQCVVLMLTNNEHT